MATVEGAPGTAAGVEGQSGTGGVALLGTEGRSREGRRQGVRRILGYAAGGRTKSGEEEGEEIGIF